MTTTTTWRDFVEQLTADQVAEIEHCEREQVPPGMNTSAHFINAALSFIAENEAQKRCAGIPTPADAIDQPTLWIAWDAGVCTRGYTCWARQSGGFEVTIAAWQFSDGRPTERDIVFEDTDDERDMTAGRYLCIQWTSNIDHDARTLTVTGKGGHRHTVPVHPEILAAAAKMPFAGYWFPSQRGRHLGGRVVSQRIRLHMIACRVPGTPHALRHYFCTELVERGADLRVVQELARHSQLSTTAQYVGVADTRKRAAIDTLTRR